MVTGREIAAGGRGFLRGDRGPGAAWDAARALPLGARRHSGTEPPGSRAQRTSIG
jgi:N-acetylglucosamine kinase-like BadF-type ATPase